MSENVATGRIPIVVGVTGHRAIPAAGADLIRERLTSLFSALKEKYPHTEVVVLSALAAGADTLCAGAALAADCVLRAPLPFDPSEYRKDFAPEDIPVFDGLIAAAESHFVASKRAFPREQDVSRAFFYQETGRYIVAHSHILLALWDGNESETAPGGTADVVRMARSGGADDVRNPLYTDTLSPVLRLPVTRNMNDIVESADAHVETNELPQDPAFIFYPAGESPRPVISGDIWGELALPLFEDIEDYNADIVKNKRVIEKIGDAREDACDAGISEIAEAYAAADALAMHCRNRRNVAVRNLSLLCLALVLAFLLYDEAVSYMMLVAYGILLLVMFAVYLVQDRKLWHEKALLYRTLAETLRIKLFMTESGIPYTPRIPVWRRERALSFVQSVVRGFAPALVRKDAEIVAETWIEGQLAYHNESKDRKGRGLRRNEIWRRGLMAAAVIFYVLVVLFETLAPELTELPLFDLSATLLPAEAMLTPAALFKIVLGTLFAGLAFLSAYYEKHALPEQIDNDEKMIALFSLAKRQCFEQSGAADIRLTLVALADAHIEETLSWYLFSSKKKPEVSIK